MNINVIDDAPTDSGDTIPAGSVVEYLGHIPGGMIQVRWNGVIYVIHPLTCEELR